MTTVARLVRPAKTLSCRADDLLMDGSNRASDQAKLIAELPSPKLSPAGAILRISPSVSCFFRLSFCLQRDPSLSCIS